MFAPRFDGKIEILDASSGEILGIASLPEGNEGEPNIAFDVKARNGRLYVASRLSGLVVFDVSQPAEPLLIGQYRVFDGEGSPENFTDIHNIFLSPNGDMLYAANTSFPLDSLSGRQTDLRPDLRVIDVSDPSSPEELARFAKVGMEGNVHDINVIRWGDRLVAFVNYWEAGLWILDVTDANAISVMSSTTWDGIISHSGWAFALNDKLYYAHAEEGYDKHLAVLDVTDLANPEIVSRFKTRQGASIHNVEIVDGIAYVAYYLDGLRVVDLRDPMEPREIGHYDTFVDEEERTLLDGAWGVRVEDGRVYISDMQSGTYAFDVLVE